MIRHAAGAWRLAARACLLAICLAQAGCGECPPVVRDGVSSPSGKLVAVVLDRPACDGGVLGSFSAYVGLRTAEESDVESAEVLEISETPHRPSLRWVDEAHLVVAVECRSDTEAWCRETGRAWEVRGRKRWRSVNIAYEAGPLLRKWSGDDVLAKHMTWW